MAKKLSKILWYGAEKDALGKPVIPPLSPSVEKHLEGLNEGEIYIHNDDEYPALYIRTNKDKIVAIGGAEALMKYFLRKDQSDTAKEVITFEKGLNVGEFVTGASGASFFKDLTTGQTIMELDKLYVRMKAFFETLTIVEAQTISGKQIISPAGSVRCTSVEEYDDYYRCYFLNEQDGEKIENKFIVGDQVYSQMFNAKTGTSNNISNRYYWRLVTGVGEDYIDLSKTDCDADSDIPMVGDVLNHRGHRYAENSERMNFIETSTVDGFSPSITLFHGVNSWSLDGKSYVQFGVDKTTNKAFMNVYGDMYVGDRNKTAYMRYTQEEGLVICGKLDVGTKLGDSYLKDLISASTPEGYQEFVEKVTQDLEGLQAQIDGTIDSYFFQYEPSLDNYPASEWDTESEKQAHLNDTFTNLVDGRSWRWAVADGVYTWVEITDTATTKALALAGKAQDTADGKRRVFVDTPYPPYDKGDLWSRGSDYPLMICVVPKASGSYEEGDFDYADNNAKLKDEMQTLVTETKDELNNSIGQATEAANTYTDNAKLSLQQSINELNESKANIDDVYTQAQADGKISEAEQSAIDAAKKQADAAIALSETTIKAYADGIVDDEEAARIKQAQENLAEAKEYAEEQAQAAKSEIENSYLFQALQDAQSTEIANGLVLTSLIQLRDTQSNIMSGINGLINASKGDKSIATWWGGDMLDLIDYYRWDGTQWVVKSGLTAPSNIPSGLIRMDGTGYLAKGKFWWDNDGKIYADPTALFLSFDVNAEEGTLSATILDIRDKQTEFANMWTEKTDSNGTKYLYTTYPLVTQGGVTMYAGTSGLDVEGIYDGLPIDGSTIYWDNGVLKSVGGGGTADAVAWENITGKPSFATVATSGSYNDLLNKPTLLSSFTNDVGYLTEHQDLSGYQTKITSSAKLAASLVSGLATVATSGSYNDLSNKPTIPTSLKNPYALSWSGYSSGSYDGSAAKSITIPTNTNQLTNGAGFITSSGSITGSSKILKFQNLISSSTINIWNGGYSTLQIHEVSQGKDVPTNYPFGYLHNYSWGATQWSNQLYFSASDYESRLFTRGYRDDTDTWTSWNTVAFLSDIDSKLSGYLPLSGGTIKNETTSPLAIDTTGTEANLRIRINGSGKASFGYKTGVGTWMRDSSARSVVIGDDGVLKYGTDSSLNTVYHSGNLTKLSQLTNDSGFITSSASISGNAATATKLATARTIWGQSFDGTGNVTGGLTDVSSIQTTGAAPIYLYRDSNKNGHYIVCDHNGFGISKCEGQVWKAICLNINYDTNNVAIGQVANSYKFHVNGSLNATTIYQNGTSLDSLLNAKLNSSSYTAADVLAKLKTVDGSGSGLDADTLDGYQLTKMMLAHPTSNEYDDCLGNRIIVVTGIVPPLNTTENRWGAVLQWSNTTDVKPSVTTTGNNWYFQLWADTISANLHYRKRVNGGNWSTIKALAFTTDNVASATKLQTARTIWGQSFDGSGNVSGDLNGVGRIIRTEPTAVDMDLAGNFIFKNPNSVASNYWHIDTSDGTLIFVVHNNGNVGIGTTRPAYKLDVNGTIRFASKTIWGQSFDGTGNVSGDLSSVGIIQFSNEKSFKIRYNGFYPTSNSEDYWWGVSRYDTNVAISVAPVSGVFQTRYATYLATSSGNVGIGTVTPSYKLHVAGNFRTNDVWIGSDTGTYIEGTQTGGLRIQYANSDKKYTQILLKDLTVTINNNLLCSGGITMYSDQRKKTILNHVELSLKDIANAPLIEHYYNSDESKTTHVGSIAQYWAGLNDWFCKLDNEGFYTMEIQNAALASAISVARELDRYESKTDKQIRTLKSRVRELEEEVKRLRA